MEDEEDNRDGVSYELETVSPDGFFIYTTKCEAGKVNRWKAYYQYNAHGILEVDFTRDTLILNNTVNPLFPNDVQIPSADKEIMQRDWTDETVLLPIEFSQGMRKISKDKEDDIKPLLPIGL